MRAARASRKKIATPAEKPPEERNVGGRPTDFTPANRETILKMIRTGATLKDAVGAAGLDYSTFTRWRRLAGTKDDPGGQFFAFFADVEKVEAEVAAGYAAVIAKAAKGYKKTKTKTVRRPVFVEGKPLTKSEPDGKGGWKEVPVFVEETTVEESQEFDWRAALEWLKRRRREDWGDSINVGGLTDEEIIAEIARALFGGEEEGAEATASGEAEGDSEAG